MITVDDLDALVRAVVDAGDPLVLETLTVLLRLALDSDPSSADRAELAAAIGESPAATDLRDLLADPISAAGAENPERQRRRRQVDGLERFVTDCGNAAVLLETVADVACEIAADLRNSVATEDAAT